MCELALIKCPECKRSISDTSIRCPFCDFVLKNEVVEEQKIVTKKCQAHQNASTNRVLKFLRFGWFFDFLNNIDNNLSAIPLVGLALSIVFKFVLLSIFFAIIVGVVGAIIAGLIYISPLLAIEVILVGSTIYMYFDTYRSDKSYYFWVALALTILFPIVFALKG